MHGPTIKIILSVYNFNRQHNPSLYDHRVILAVTTIGFTYKIWTIFVPYLCSCKTSWWWLQKQSKHVDEY